MEKGLERAGLTSEQIGKVKKLIEERDAKKGAAPAPAAAAPSGPAAASVSAPKEQKGFWGKVKGWLGKLKK